MNSADRRALENELARTTETLVECQGELDGRERALTWIDAAGEHGVDDVVWNRAIDLADEAQGNVRYYAAKVQELTDILDEDERRADNRAFEAGCGARR